MAMPKSMKCERGQGLVEYLIIVALMAVATIAIVRLMGQTVATRFAAITHALQGDKSSVKKVHVDAASFRKRDLGDFMSGASGKMQKNEGEGESDQ